MREILFRGKHVYSGEWVYGIPLFDLALCSLKCENQHNGEIITFFGWNDGCHEYDEFNVDPTTIGQYTGLTDRNGVKIFEGDVVHIFGDDVGEWKGVDYNALIAFIDGGFCAIDGTVNDYAFRRYALPRMDFNIEIIGNIHDNSELLK